MDERLGLLCGVLGVLLILRPLRWFAWRLLGLPRSDGRPPRHRLSRWFHRLGRHVHVSARQLPFRVATQLHTPLLALQILRLPPADRLPHGGAGLDGPGAARGAAGHHALPVSMLVPNAIARCIMAAALPCACLVTLATWDLWPEGWPRLPLAIAVAIAIPISAFLPLFLVTHWPARPTLDDYLKRVSRSELPSLLEGAAWLDPPQAPPLPAPPRPDWVRKPFGSVSAWAYHGWLRLRLGWCGLAISAPAGTEPGRCWRSLVYFVRGAVVAWLPFCTWPRRLRSLVEVHQNSLQRLLLCLALERVVVGTAQRARLQARPTTNRRFVQLYFGHAIVLYAWIVAAILALALCPARDAAPAAADTRPAVSGAAVYWEQVEDWLSLFGGWTAADCAAAGTAPGCAMPAEAVAGGSAARPAEATQAARDQIKQDRMETSIDLLAAALIFWWINILFYAFGALAREMRTLRYVLRESAVVLLPTSIERARPRDGLLALLEAAEQRWVPSVVSAASAVLLIAALTLVQVVGVEAL